FIANQRNYSEAYRLTCAILLIFGSLYRGRKKRSDGLRFLAIDLAVAGGAGNPMRDGVRPQMDSARVAQRLDAAVVGNHVAELDDLGNAPKMFDETGRAAKGLACQIVDGDLPIVQ